MLGETSEQFVWPQFQSFWEAVVLYHEKDNKKLPAETLHLSVPDQQTNTDSCEHAT